MESKTRLLASSGKEFAKPAGIFQNSSEVRKARKEAMSRLGLDFLDVADGDEMDLDKELATGDIGDPAADSESKLNIDSPSDEFGPEALNGLSSPGDAKPDLPATSHGQATPMERVKSTTPGQSEDELAGMSARERNRLKRKRKLGNSAFVTAPPPQNSGSKYKATAAGASSSK